MDTNHRSHSLDHSSYHTWNWWPSDLTSFAHDDPSIDPSQHFISTPSPAASFATPLSDSYLLKHHSHSPYTYHASPRTWHREPVPRSMSVSALQSRVEQPVSHANSGGLLPPPNKPLRFVSSDGLPNAKRRRITAACLTCRKRKTRCSGERPHCKTCTDNGHECNGYADRTHRREDEKTEEENGDDDNHSGSSSPKKQKREPGSLTQDVDHALRPLARLKTQNSSDSTTSAKSLVKEEPGEVFSPASAHTAASSLTSARNRVPYFRYFGPTAIVPGFKQMVVQVKDHRRSLPSASGESVASVQHFDSVSISGRERSPIEIPFYDANDPAPNAPLITHLCETFFSHLGCNYPFLQRERFLHDLEDKTVDAILVDAVCAVAARFSSDPTLTRTCDTSVPVDENNNVRKAFRGNVFAQRAMSAVVDTFACPTMAVAQACLLLAYEEFGTDHDSGLWMYLGTAIRMAQDLGIQKLEGLQLEGRIGPTPKSAKLGQEGKDEENRRAEQQKKLISNLLEKESSKIEDRRASEHERIDTFWGIFFLDRAVSSGVGRPVTLRDKDIEISFPSRLDDNSVNGCPHPFPPLIRIVHMYGRVADVLNNIKEVSQVTPEVLKRLANMEKDLTGIYQRLSPKLHFSATNFQHYVKADQGTNFILLHFWFHTLIVLLHQPTLLHSFEGRIQQLFPDSRELSMSSAKTIADILAFVELIDLKSFIGNPFTSQPVYVAACAFLAEAAHHASQPSSRSASPPAQVPTPVGTTTDSQSAGRAESDHRAASSKHTLLAAAANQNYQRCYKALQVLDSYWAGCRYILTALDQKSKGLMDPLLFTSDDVDGEMPSTEPSFTTPGWRRSTSHSASMGGPCSSPSKIHAMQASQAGLWSPGRMDWSQAIGWSLTGTTNSPAPNLSFLYPNTVGDTTGRMSPVLEDHKEQVLVKPDAQNAAKMNNPSRAEAQVHDHSFAHLDQAGTNVQSYASPTSMMPPPHRQFSSLAYDPVSATNPELMLGLQSPYSVSSAGQPQIPSDPNTPPMSAHQAYDFRHPHSQTQPQQLSSTGMLHSFLHNPHQNFSDMLIESQDIDMSGHNGNFAFPAADMIPWLEYLPAETLSYFEPHDDSTANTMSGGNLSSGLSALKVRSGEGRDL